MKGRKENSISRIRNSAKNLSFAVIGQLIVAVFTFLERKVFINFLSLDYLGINGLYSSILTVLSLADLGIGSAIIYSLYSPLADDDQEQIASLIRLFRKAYFIIGTTVLAIGLALIPFLHLIVKSELSRSELYIYYILFLVNTVISYFYSYKTSLIEADQKKYIITSVTTGVQIVLYVLQLSEIMVFRNFYAYLILAIVMNWVKYAILSHKADKMYPILKKKEVKPLDREVTLNIKRNIKALFMHKIGSVVVNSTDNILTSALISLATVGLYSNYLMVFNGLSTSMWMFYAAIVASIGNLCASESRSQIFDSFRNLNIATFIVHAVCTTVLFVCMEPFISYCFGSNLCLGQETVTLLCLSFYIYGMRKGIGTYREAMGLYWFDRYKPLAESAVNLIASIILGKLWGLNGIILGTIISAVFSCVIVEPYVVFRHGFKRNPLSYYRDYFLKLGLMVLMCLGSYFICSLLPLSGITGLITYAVISIIISVSVLLGIYRKDEGCRKLIDIVKTAVSRNK